MRMHIPFRKWRPHFLKGERNDPHKMSTEKEHQEIPTMSWDHLINLFYGGLSGFGYKSITLDTFGCFLDVLGFDIP